MIGSPIALAISCSTEASPALENLGDVVHKGFNLTVNGKKVTGKALDVIAIKPEYNPNYETSIVNIQLRNGMIGFIKVTLMRDKNMNGFPIIFGREWTPNTLFFAEAGNSPSNLHDFIDLNIDWAIQDQPARDRMNAINVNPCAIEFNAFGIWNKQALYY